MSHWTNFVGFLSIYYLFFYFWKTFILIALILGGLYLMYNTRYVKARFRHYFIKDQKKF